jgi:hypothetical protein
MDNGMLSSKYKTGKWKELITTFKKYEEETYSSENHITTYEITMNYIS